MNTKEKELSDRHIPEFRICMIGAKCTGKTSMLTSLMNQFDAVAKEVGLSFEAEDKFTQESMDNKIVQLQNLFAKCKLQEDAFDPLELEVEETTELEVGETMISRTRQADEYTFCIRATDMKAKMQKEPVNI